MSEQVGTKRQPQQSRRHGIIAALLALPVLLAGCSGGDPAEATSPSGWEAEQANLTKLYRVAAQCAPLKGSPAAATYDAYVVVGDDGSTLVVDSEGDESEGVSWERVQCLLENLEVSDSVRAKMGNTRALDGTQTGEWGDFAATWSYHPRSGMSLVIEEAT